MKLQELVTKLGLTVCSGKNGLDKEITGAYVSDLLSDVMGNAQAGMIWITLQTHKNVMAVASLKDLAAIILVKGNTPDEDTKEQSELEGLTILNTKEQTFEIAGKIYTLIKK